MGKYHRYHFFKAKEQLGFDRFCLKRNWPIIPFFEEEGDIGGAHLNDELKKIFCERFGVNDVPFFYGFCYMADSKREYKPHTPERILRGRKRTLEKRKQEIKEKFPLFGEQLAEEYEEKKKLQVELYDLEEIAKQQQERLEAAKEATAEPYKAQYEREREACSMSWQQKDWKKINQRWGRLRYPELYDADGKRKEMKTHKNFVPGNEDAPPSKDWGHIHRGGKGGRVKEPPKTYTDELGCVCCAGCGRLLEPSFDYLSIEPLIRQLRLRKDIGREAREKARLAVINSQSGSVLERTERELKKLLAGKEI